MRICVDIDGTLCMPATGTDYRFAVPVREMVEYVRALKRAGHTIILYTARGSGTGKDWAIVTERQLREWAVPYDELHFGKPYADVYIDDRAVNVFTATLILRLSAPVEEDDGRKVDE